MKEIYIPNHFVIQELVPPDVYKALAERAWIVLDPRIVWTLDMIRKKFGKYITVNNWHEKGTYDERGFRTPASVGANYSQHRFGRAADFSIDGMTSDEFRADLKKNPTDPAYQYITACELKVTWNHVDVRPIPRGSGLLWINP